MCVVTGLATGTGPSGKAVRVDTSDGASGLSIRAYGHRLEP